MHIVTKIVGKAYTCRRAICLIRQVLSIVLFWKQRPFVSESENTYNKSVTLTVNFPNQIETESNKIDLLWLLSKKVQYLFPLSALLMFSFYYFL